MKTTTYTYAELASEYDLWMEYVDPSGLDSEEAFEAMSMETKLKLIEGCFGPEVAEPETATTIWEIRGRAPINGNWTSLKTTVAEARTEIEDCWDNGDYPAETIAGLADWPTQKVLRFWAVQVQEMREIEIERA